MRYLFTNKDQQLGLGLSSAAQEVVLLQDTKEEQELSRTEL